MISISELRHILTNIGDKLDERILFDLFFFHFFPSIWKKWVLKIAVHKMPSKDFFFFFFDLLRHGRGNVAEGSRRRRWKHSI